jgi:hypothetical protein
VPAAKKQNQAKIQRRRHRSPALVEVATS